MRSYGFIVSISQIEWKPTELLTGNEIIQNSIIFFFFLSFANLIGGNAHELHTWLLTQGHRHVHIWLFVISLYTSRGCRLNRIVNSIRFESQFSAYGNIFYFIFIFCRRRQLFVTSSFGTFWMSYPLFDWYVWNGTFILLRICDSIIIYGPRRIGMEQHHSFDRI